MTNTAVIVPRRADNGWRDDIWNHCRTRWEAAGHHPIEGDHDDGGPFNRSAALNEAAADHVARAADVLVVIDADIIIDPDRVGVGIAEAHRTGRVVFPFDKWLNINRPGARAIVDGYDGNWWPYVDLTMDATCSSCVIIPRPAWDDIGGFDPLFVGWGMEDVAFLVAARTTCGIHRIPGEVWHLAHDSQPRTPVHYDANVERLRRYEQADGNRNAVLALSREHLRDEAGEHGTTPHHDDEGDIPPPPPSAR